MRRCSDLSKDQERLLPIQFCPDCIIATRGYDFQEGQGTPGQPRRKSAQRRKRFRTLLGIGSPTAWTSGGIAVINFR
jgi:hypothetical protein